jgi:hydroxymethylglutaryl-CoA lyase
LIDKSANLGVKTVTLCDTIGVADPAQTEALVEVVQKEFPSLQLGMHLHDTRGMALANTLTAMQCGITEFETSIGGLGGCPFAPGAAGNAATEDLLNMTDRLGVETGVSPGKLYDAVCFVRDAIKSDLISHMAKVQRAG